MILSQLIDADELKRLTPERLRELILKLDQEIKVSAGSGEKLLFAIEATVVGVKDDRPAGTNIEIVRTNPEEAGKK